MTTIILTPGVSTHALESVFAARAITSKGESRVRLYRTLEALRRDATRPVDKWPEDIDPSHLLLEYLWTPDMTRAGKRIDGMVGVYLDGCVYASVEGSAVALSLEPETTLSLLEGVVT